VPAKPPVRPVGSRVVSGSHASASARAAAASSKACIDASKPACAAAAAAAAVAAAATTTQRAPAARFMPTRPASGKVGAAKAAAAAAGKTSEKAAPSKAKPAAPSAAVAKRASALAEQKTAAARAPSAAGAEEQKQPELVQRQEPTLEASTCAVETPQATPLVVAAASGDSAAASDAAYDTSAAFIVASGDAGMASPPSASASAASAQPSPTSSELRELRRTLVEALGESAQEVPLPGLETQQQLDASESAAESKEEPMTPPQQALELEAEIAAPAVVEEQQQLEPLVEALAEQVQPQEAEAHFATLVEPETERQPELETLATEEPHELGVDAAPAHEQVNEPLGLASLSQEVGAPMATDALDDAASPAPATLEEHETNAADADIEEPRPQTVVVALVAAEKLEAAEETSTPTVEEPGTPEAEQAATDETPSYGSAEQQALPPASPQPMPLAAEQPSLLAAAESIAELCACAPQATVAPELRGASQASECSVPQLDDAAADAVSSSMPGSAVVSAAASPAARSVRRGAPQTPSRNSDNSAASSPRRSTRTSARPTPLRTPLAPVASASSNIPRSSSPLKPRSALSSPLKAAAAAAAAAAPRSVRSSPLKPPRSTASSPLKKTFSRGDFASHSVGVPEDNSASPSRCYNEESEYDSEALPDDSIDLVRFSASSPTKPVLQLQRPAVSQQLDASLTVDTSSSALTEDDEHDVRPATPAPLPLRRSTRHRRGNSGASVVVARAADGRVQLVCGSGWSSDAPGPSSDTVF
jgi:hypothetical protein